MGRHYLYFFQKEEYIVFLLPQNEDIETVCRAYAKNFYNRPPSPKHYMRQMLRLILKENSFQLQWKALPPNPPYTAMRTKTAVSSAKIFMSYIETQSLSS